MPRFRDSSLRDLDRFSFASYLNEMDQKGIWLQTETGSK